MLAARTARAEKIDPEVLLGNLDLVLLVGLGKHDDRRGGSVDAPLRLSLGNALDAMCT